MNLRPLANALTQTINANQSIAWVRSTGYSTDAAGKRTPTTETTTIQAQIQALDGDELKQADAMNLQGVLRAVYMYGNVQGVVRADQIGGDVLGFPEIPGGSNRAWLVCKVLETWPTWCKVIVRMQSEAQA